jgi:hypothetical protein
MKEYEVTYYVKKGMRRNREREAKTVVEANTAAEAVKVLRAKLSGKLNPFRPHVVLFKFASGEGGENATGKCNRMNSVKSRRYLTIAR